MFNVCAHLTTTTCEAAQVILLYICNYMYSRNPPVAYVVTVGFYCLQGYRKVMACQLQTTLMDNI